MVLTLTWKILKQDSLHLAKLHNKQSIGSLLLTTLQDLHSLPFEESNQLSHTHLKAHTLVVLETQVAGLVLLVDTLVSKRQLKSISTTFSSTTKDQLATPLTKVSLSALPLIALSSLEHPFLRLSNGESQPTKSS